MKLILVGKAAAGKDYFRARLKDKGFRGGVSHTTRPPRETEIEGIDYYYVTDEMFIEMEENGEMLEFMDFKGWKYGLTIDEYNNSDVLIMSPDGLKKLPDHIKKECLIIYLDIPPTTRLTRLIIRNDSYPPMEREAVDAIQFNKFKEFDLRVTNPEF
jgi:guanylate kinase